MSVELIRLLSSESGLARDDVWRIMRSAPHRYKSYTVPKKGRAGRREISQPSKEVKYLQRILIQWIRPQLPIHEAAMAYEPGSKIRANAEAHVNSRYLLKLDIENFFPSITYSDVENHFKKWKLKIGDSEMSAEEVELLTRLSVKKHESMRSMGLAIGAPSSPFIGNTIMYDIDCSIAQECERADVQFTRYADDLTFSTKHPDILKSIESAVLQIIDLAEYPRLVANDRKTVHASMAGRRIVTGLVLTPTGKVSLGREKKRWIRAALHRAKRGELSDEDVAVLKGHMAVAKDVEYEFYRSMQARYGALEGFL